MEKKDFDELIGKKVFILVREDWHYSGIILSVGDEYIKMKDKFGKTILIRFEEIKFLRQEE